MATPITPPRPRTPPPRPAPPARPAKAPGWGWLEWLVLAQTAIPALLFVPGFAPVRIVTRMGVYGLALVAWIAVGLVRRRGPGGPFPPRAWLGFCIGYMALSLFHPYTNSLPAGAMSILLNLAVMSPAFWAADALASPRQIPRIMAILFVCNGLSAAVGVGQVYQPERFSPPKLNSVGPYGEDALKITLEDGTKLMRPSGLTDSPGAASGAGQVAALVGLCWALAPIRLWKRLACVALAMAGLASVYFTQVRSMLVVAALAMLLVVILLALQRDFKRAALLGVGGTAVLVASFAWAVAVMGNTVSSRFSTVTNSNFIGHNRGGFVQDTFERILPMYPLGAGLGRWGMMYTYFGDRAAPLERGPLWAEVQVTGWAYDGGVPLLIAYLGAVLVAVFDSLRIALTCKDRDLAFWATVITASNLVVVPMCFALHVFISPLGMQFWLLSATLHAADRLSRRGADPAARPRATTPTGRRAT